MKAKEIKRTFTDAIVSVGYIYELRKRRDGTFFLSATGYSRWQGSVSDDRWEYDLDADTLIGAKEEAETFCSAMNPGEEFNYSPDFNDAQIGENVNGWVKTRKGHVIQ